MRQLHLTTHDSSFRHPVKPRRVVKTKKIAQPTFPSKINLAVKSN